MRKKRKERKQCKKRDIEEMIGRLKEEEGKRMKKGEGEDEGEGEMYKKSRGRETRAQKTRRGSMER